MAVTIKITSAGANISDPLEIWTGQTLLSTSYYISVSKSLLESVEGYTFMPPVGAMAFQVKSTGICTTSFNLECTCDPQYAWISVGDGTFYREVTHPVTDPISPYTLIKADGYAGYSNLGTNVYNVGFNIDGSGSPAQNLPNYNIWKNTYNNTTDGPLNRTGIWTDQYTGSGPTKTMLPLDTWIGFNYCLTGLVAGKTYYVGLGGDNDYKLTLDGTVILDTHLRAYTVDSFNYWHIYPVTVGGGTSILGLYGLNRDTGSILNIAAFGCEIYDNTLPQLVAATDISQLNVIFTSLGKTPATIVQNLSGTYLSNGYTCNSGGIYSACPTGTCIEKIICTGSETTTTTTVYVPPTTTTTTTMSIPLSFGYLYNYYSFANIAPAGWHVPTDAEWHTLALYLDATSTSIVGNESTTAGGMMKEVGTTHWTSPNIGATDSYGFAGRGGGHRNFDGVYQQMYNSTTFASSTSIGSGPSFSYWYRSIFANNTILYRNHDLVNCGFSIRLIKNDSVDPGSLTDWDGNTYPTIKIGTQVWTKENLRVIHYNNGVSIPNLVSNSAWSSTTSGAYATYVL